MRRVLTTTLLAALSLAAADPASAQTRGAAKVQPTQRPAAAQGAAAVDLGTVEGDTYSNNYFGLSFSIPRGWFVQDMEMRKALVERGKEIVGEGATNRKMAELEASVARTVYLLNVSKYDPRAPGAGFNAQIACLAERVPTAVVKTGADYLTLMTRTAQGTGAKLELTGPIRTEKVGAVTFAAADAKLTVGPGAAAQKYYVAIIKNHALMFAYTYVDEADAKAFDDLIKTIKFK